MVMRAPFTGFLNGNEFEKISDAVGCPFYRRGQLKLNAISSSCKTIHWIFHCTHWAKECIGHVCSCPLSFVLNLCVLGYTRKQGQAAFIHFLGHVTKETRSLRIERWPIFQIYGQVPFLSGCIGEFLQGYLLICLCIYLFHFTHRSPYFFPCSTQLYPDIQSIFLPPSTVALQIQNRHTYVA